MSVPRCKDAFDWRRGLLQDKTAWLWRVRQLHQSFCELFKGSSISIENHAVLNAFTAWWQIEECISGSKMAAEMDHPMLTTEEKQTILEYDRSVSKCVNLHFMWYNWLCLHLICDWQCLFLSYSRLYGFLKLETPEEASKKALLMKVGGAPPIASAILTSR